MNGPGLFEGVLWELFGGCHIHRRESFPDHGASTMLAQCWHDAGTMLARCGHGAGTVLARIRGAICTGLWHSLANVCMPCSPSSLFKPPSLRGLTLGNTANFGVCLARTLPWAHQLHLLSILGYKHTHQTSRAISPLLSRVDACIRENCTLIDKVQS